MSLPCNPDRGEPTHDGHLSNHLASCTTMETLLMSNAVEIDEDVLQEAAHSLYLHLGSLMDLPEELRNTLTSIYYEVHWLRRKEGAMPLVAHLPSQKNQQKQLDMAMKQAILRLEHYQMAATLVEGIREADKDTQPNLYGALVQLALDKLKWNIKNSFKKSELHRSLNKIGKKPLPEVPDLHKRMRQLLLEQAFSRSSSQVDETECITLGPSARVVRPRKG